MADSQRSSMIPAHVKNQQEAKPAPRPERELLEEVLEILRSQEQRIQKEREEKELTGLWGKYFISKLASEKEPTWGLRTYLDVLQSSDKKVSDKGPPSPSMRQPSKKKEPSNVERSEE